MEKINPVDSTSITMVEVNKNFTHNMLVSYLIWSIQSMENGNKILAEYDELRRKYEKNIKIK